MKYEVKVTHSAEKAAKKWKKSNPRLHKKFTDLIKELEQHPHSGTGHPEALVGGKNITWSRHITAHDRIIYDIYEDVVIVLLVKVEGHYDDK